MTDTLFDSLTSWDTLFAGWRKVLGNGGCAGGDGVTLERYGRDLPANLRLLSGLLKNGGYAPGPLRRLLIPKSDGGRRPLAVPTVADRILQTAMAQILTPRFERGFSESSFGYRPGRSVRMAVSRIEALRGRGFGWVVEADIVRFFETVPHDPLLDLLERSLPDAPRLTGLIALWLEHGGLELDTPGKGLPQGSPLSPLLSNLYLDDFDDALTKEAAVVRYGDDFVLMARTEAAALKALDRAQGWMTTRGLRLHEDETRVVTFDKGFRFLGQRFLRGMVVPAPDADDRALDDLMRHAARADQKAEDQELPPDAGAGHDPGARVLYLTEPGRRLVQANESFAVEGESGQELLRLAHGRVDRIELWPGTRVEADVIRHALATDTDLAFVDGHGAAQGWLVPPGGGDGALHLAQAKVVLNPTLSTDLARRIVDGRIRNMRARLQVLNRGRSDPEVIAAATTLGRRLRSMSRATDVNALRGHEGAAAAIYWPAVARLCDGENGPFTRQRPARNPLNVTLNILCSLLERDMRAAILAAGLHPGFGVLHAAGPGRDPCVWDLMEGFRALLTEGLAVALFNKKHLTPDMFSARGDMMRVSSAGQRACIIGYEAALNRPRRSAHTGKHHKMRVILREEARALVRHCRDPEGAPFTPQVQDY